MRESRPKQEQEQDLDVYIGKRLKELRIKRGFTRTDVAQKEQCSQQLIHKLENAASEISLNRIMSLSCILGVDPGYFFDGFAETQTEPRVPREVIQQPQQAMPLNVLLIEDDAAAVYLTQRACEGTAAKINLFAIHDGVEAITFLRRRMTAPLFPHPDVILLDLNIPKKDGHAVLREIKRDPELRAIPVVIVSNSNSIEEMKTCYREHAAGFIHKSFDFETYQRCLNGFIHYWTAGVILPRHHCVEEGALTTEA